MTDNTKELGTPIRRGWFYFLKRGVLIYFVVLFVVSGVFGADFSERTKLAQNSKKVETMLQANVVEAASVPVISNQSRENKSPMSPVVREQAKTSVRLSDTTSSIGEIPVWIDIPVINVHSLVSNPVNVSIATLDAALLKGVVRYPGSGLLGREARVFLFGHSTTYKVVKNKAYQAFNRLGELKKGDEISVYSATSEYRYLVSDVLLVNKDEAFVELTGGEMTLTLSTCNTFGKKEERFVVNARFIGIYQRAVAN